MKVRKSDILYFVLFIFIFNVRNSIVFISNYNFMYLLIGLCCLVLLLIYKYLKISSFLLSLIEKYIVPYVLVTVLSIATAILIHHEPFKPYVSQTLVYAALHLSAFVTAFYIYSRIGKRVVSIMISSAVFAYSTLILKWVYVAGIPGCFNFINNTIQGITLEVNNLTYACGLLFIFVLLSDGICRKQKSTWLILLGIIIVLGNKRAIYLAIAIALLVYVSFSFFLSDNKKALKTVSFSLVCAALLWIYVIKSGLLELIVAYFGINTMSRMQLWNYVSQAYECSLFYFGRGIVYSDMQTISEAYIHLYGISGGSSQIHNDILRVYIGWGFLPFLYYFYRILYKNVKIIGKKSTSIGWKYFTVMIYLFIIYFFDNMFTAFNVTIVLFLILIDYEKQVTNNLSVQ